MPEVSLVAILDADKEGFLRSTSSLIQTIGRAARNVRGKAILYADRITGSMEQAIGETTRRRERQVTYNEAHGITPQTIVSRINDVMEGARSEPEAKKGRGRVAASERRVAEQRDDYRQMNPDQLGAVLKKLENLMYKHAKDLEFEEAGKIRDEIRRIKSEGLVG
jgi:excinuclease ABC subunit B